jgi:hypothetical protein
VKKGYLSQYFEGVAAKRLVLVEVRAEVSNQHEFNGATTLKRLFGEPTGKEYYKTRFVYLTDSEEEFLTEDGQVTWYDSRAKNSGGANRSEYRCYYKSNSVAEKASVGDLLVLALLPDRTLLALIAKQGTTIESQVAWLFDVGDLQKSGFLVRNEGDLDRDRVEFASRRILESLGIETVAPAENYLEEMLQKFNGGFPATSVFSAYARSTLKDVHVKDDPDAALMAWMEQEESLFRTLEKHLISDRLKQGFDGDVESFISYSLSVQNRRKSRVGLALENHIEQVFKDSGLRYARAVLTERKSRPDFIFPGQAEYHDVGFDAGKLLMLGVKSTCKDRWRQVLSEAERVKKKHLLTLEAAISVNQTDEMQAHQLQLVLPARLHETYAAAQRPWLMNVSDFVKVAKGKPR